MSSEHLTKIEPTAKWWVMLIGQSACVVAALLFSELPGKKIQLVMGHNNADREKEIPKVTIQN